MPANGGLLRIGYRSPGSEIDSYGSEIADSLQRILSRFRETAAEWRREWGNYISQYRSSRTATSLKIAKALLNAAEKIEPARPDLAVALKSVQHDFVALGRRRNDLLHANPANSNGVEVLVRRHFEAHIVWDFSEVDRATQEFEALFDRVSGIFFRQL
jgi:hypothetical protein